MIADASLADSCGVVDLLQANIAEPVTRIVGGRKIGNGNVLCRWANATRQLCWGEIRLPLGKLVIIGSSQTRILGEYAVIGGTGVYTFKQGLFAFRQLSVNKYAIRVLLA